MRSDREQNNEHKVRIVLFFIWWWMLLFVAFTVLPFVVWSSLDYAHDLVLSIEWGFWRPWTVFMFISSFIYMVAAQVSANKEANKS